jgi:hypothetical protein
MSTTPEVILFLTESGKAMAAKCSSFANDLEKPIHTLTGSQ